MTEKATIARKSYDHLLRTPRPRPQRGQVAARAGRTRPPMGSGGVRRADRDLCADRNLNVAVRKVAEAFTKAYKRGRETPDDAAADLDQTRTDAEHILAAAEASAGRMLGGDSGVAE